jgi:creatinine amidohydrolase
MLKKWTRIISSDFSASESLGLLCVGSCEQHSDYLPLGTDSFIGEKIAEDAATIASTEVIMLPSLRVGFSPHHRAFPGYITLSQKTMFSYLIEVCLCAYENGISKIMILNSHGGNQSCLQAVVNELGSVYNKQAVLVRYWDLISQSIDKIRDSEKGGMGHAGEFETSLMMYYYPELVDKSRIDNREIATGNYWHNPDMFASNKVYIYKPFDEYSNKGNVGQPQYASREKGGKLAQIISKELARLMDYQKENSF